MPPKQDSSSSSDKKQTSTEPTIAEEEDDEPVKTNPVGNKLTVQHLAQFGFNLAEEAKRDAALAETGGGAGAGAFAKAIAARKKKSRNQNQTVVYGADPDDVDDFDDDYPILDDDDLAQDQQQEEEEGGQEAEMAPYRDKTGQTYFDDYLADDMWEDDDEEEGEEEEDEEEGDDEELERLRQEAYESWLEAEEEERERIRELRLAEIRKKKEILIERYLRVARVMIGHRKKNIYLQDYLYHLAFRKGVLREGQNYGGNGDLDSEDLESALNKAMKRRQQKKNSTMAARFARFLRKTGHFHDELPEDRQHHHHRTGDQNKAHHAHHQQQHHHHNKWVPPHKRNLGQTYSRPNFSSNDKKRHHHHHHNRYQKRIPTTLVRKNDRTCIEAQQEGQECPINRRTLAKMRLLRNHIRAHHGPHGTTKRSASKSSYETVKEKPKTLQEVLEQKAAATLHRAMKTANEALEAFEKHRCRMAKKKQLIKIAKLLERAYSGMTLMEQERNHLVSFVETSVKAQSLAKKKALRRQQRHEERKTQKSGVVNLNHQWTKSLERIRELRLKEAKLKQEHRLVLLRKVKHWHVWEKRNATALDAVYEFVSTMASHVNMSRGETIAFQHNLEQFKKQLYTLHEAMLGQLARMFKARNTLGMAQRKIKDSTSVASPMMKGFTIGDYERMSIENHDSHQKLMERQEHLKEQYEKLKRYVKQVSDSHLNKQRSWGALRAGRHDMKQLWELCLSERDNLLRKLKEIQRVELLHKRLFMQISVAENKRLFKDFHAVDHCVKELKDTQRTLYTEYVQTQSLLQVLNVKLKDMKLRSVEEKRKATERRSSKDMENNKDTIRARIAPRIPNTIHNVNIRSKASQKRFLEQDGRQSSTPTRIGTEPKSIEKSRLPKI